MISILLIVAVVAISVFLWGIRGSDAPKSGYAGSKFGDYLAKQHAIYADDFEMAAKFAESLADVDADVVQNDRAVSMFLAGQVDESFSKLSSKTGMSARAAYAAYKLQNDDWKAVRAAYKDSTSVVMAPVRIWSSVATGNVKEALDYVKKAGNTEPWQLFMRGMIYAETGKIKQAVDAFDLVPIEFINLNDYLYMRAFYIQAGLPENAEQLDTDFTSRPGGLFLMNMSKDIDFSEFTGYKAALAFSLIQTVSHSPILSSSNFSILLLRLAEAAVPKESRALNNAINYYMGTALFATNRSWAEEFFAKIDKSSPFVPFVEFKLAEASGPDRKIVRAMDRILEDHPLFFPAINRATAIHQKNGNPGRSVRLLDRALKQPEISGSGRALLLTMRARANLMRGDLRLAADDIAQARDLSSNDAGAMAVQSAVWVAARKNLDEAYHLSLVLVKNFPSDIASWDALGQVVKLREGAKEALDIYERVGRVAETNSKFFENFGDLLKSVGEKARAKGAYEKALRLSVDGLTSQRELRRKMKK